MSISRREFIQMLAMAGAAGLSLPGCSVAPKRQMAAAPSNFYEVPNYGNVSFLHFTDCHAQLLPIYFREPNINIGVAGMAGHPPHLVGKNFLDHFNIPAGGINAHAFTHLDFVEASRQYGKVGGFAHLATLVKQLRAQRPHALLLDGGDTWQGSATALWTNAQDMVDACKLLGVDVMTAHWEFTYGEERVKEIIEKDLEGHIDFVAQNVIDNEWEEPVFKGYTMKEQNGIQVAIIGQAFPYTPIANPRHMVPKWSFGIRDQRMQDQVDKARAEGAQVVIVLSHNGMDVDLKMARRVVGIDAILGGHTHDAIPAPIEVKNAKGTTLVVNTGSNGKFLSVLDFNVQNGKVKGHQFRMLPVFSNLLAADAEMEKFITDVRAPFKAKLEEKLAVADELLYRRGNFNGTFDQLIMNAMLEVQGAEIAFSPGFRWGISKLPGEAITFEDVMTQTAITYPQTTLNHMEGSFIKEVLEDVADNLFNDDPYYQQGGDMVRVGGLKYAIDPNKKIGERITDMELNGKPIDPKKKYAVAGWASVQENVEGKPIWDVVAEYLRHKKVASVPELNMPVIKNMSGNPGMADA
ncbi:MAG: thiosulfohydrolase SoxB [Gammaproteobacteria bacterium]|nr:thiosulfohydrolase SoxB [Gammaproteobacteria bacterium]